MGWSWGRGAPRQHSDGWSSRWRCPVTAGQADCGQLSPEAAAKRRQTTTKTARKSLLPRITLVSLLLGLLAQPVAAKDTKIGTVTVNLSPPIGFCELEPGQPSDARMINAVEGGLAATGNRLLGMSVGCAELTDWRAGKRPLLDSIVQFQTLKAMEVAAPLPMRTEDLVGIACYPLRSPNEPLEFELTPRAKARAEEISKQIKLNETKSIGVVTQDQLACYFAALDKFQAETGTQRIQLTLSATTFLKGKVVYFLLTVLYRSATTLEETLARHKVNVERLHAANPR